MSIPLAYVLIGNGSSECVVTCPTGYYANNTNNTCLICNSSCITCKYNANYCLTCKLGLFILNNKCYNPCPFTYY
jgi:proprotein convertase subtilisin/kexin type 5